VTRSLRPSSPRTHRPARGPLLAALASISLAACAPDATAPAHPSGPDAPLLQQNWAGGFNTTCISVSFPMQIDDPVIDVGGQTHASFHPQYASGITSWSSKDSAVAIPTQDQYATYVASVRGIAPGITCIKAKVGQLGTGGETNGSVRLAVRGVRVADASVTAPAGTARQLDVVAAIAYDGTPVPAGPINWYSPEPTVASVDAAGLVTANRSGTATITASIGGQVGFVPVTVKPTVTIAGPTQLLSGGGGTYTANTVGCNPACTYQWIVKYIDPIEGDAIQQDFGDQKTTYIRPQGSYGRKFEVRVTVTSGTMTAWDSRMVSDPTPYP
jgi:hypothetical protein